MFHLRFQKQVANPKQPYGNLTVVIQQKVSHHCCLSLCKTHLQGDTQHVLDRGWLSCVCGMFQMERPSGTDGESLGPQLFKNPCRQQLPGTQATRMRGDDEEGAVNTACSCGLSKRCHIMRVQLLGLELHNLK